MNTSIKIQLLLILLLLTNVCVGQEELECKPVIPYEDATFANAPSSNSTLNNFSGTITNTTWTAIGTPDIITPGINGWQGDCDEFWDDQNCDENDAIDIIRTDLKSDVFGENDAIARGYIDHDETLHTKNENVLGAIEAEGVFCTVKLEPGETYYLRFSQVNARRQRHNQFISSARWVVTLDNVEIGKSIYMPTASHSEGELAWQQSIMVFEADDSITGEDPRTLRFVMEELHQEADHLHNFKNAIENTVFPLDYDQANIFNYLLLDNISLVQEGHCTAAPGVTDKNNSSFIPEIEEPYVISAWVKEQHATEQTTYSSNIEISFNNGNTVTSPIQFSPSGNIIDGWQRIEGHFTIPLGSTDINIVLNNTVDPNPAYFDDIRIFNANGSMKSFVYDPVTQRLMAELDENNYATLYEYDKEGGLVRVKKETERGIYTIQETRSGNSKLNITE